MNASRFITTDCSHTLANTETKEPFPITFPTPSNLNWDNDRGQRRRFQTDSLVEFKPVKGIDDSFMVSEELFHMVRNQNETPRRMSLTPVSYPRNDLSSAFGSSVFSSNWMHNEAGSATLNDQRPASGMAMNEDNELIAVAKTIEHLGLDEPMHASQLRNFNPPGKTRPRSLSFPHDFNIEYSKMMFDRGSRTATDLVYTSPDDMHGSGVTGISEPVVTKPGSYSSTVSFPSKESEHYSMHESKTMAPSRSLWVGNLDSSVGIATLNNVFSQFGTIESARILADKECAFVNFTRLEDAIKAKNAVQGGKLGNCIMRIGFGKPESVHDSQGMPATKSLWIGNLAENTKPYDLEVAFGKFGPVESARVLVFKFNFSHTRIVDLLIFLCWKTPLPQGMSLMGGESMVRLSKLDLQRFRRRPNTPSQLLKDCRTLQITFLDSWEALWIESTEILLTKMTFWLYQSCHKRLFVRSNKICCENTGNYSTVTLITATPGMLIAAFLIFTMMLSKCAQANIYNSDYIGNVVIQKLMERLSQEYKLSLIEKIAPHLASLGVHKNGTWAVQKIIDEANTSSQVDVIVSALEPYVPALLLDQFGNYVIQCCLRLGSNRNQFIFDAMSNKCLELGQGRFGARAMKACLESQYTTKAQQKQVSQAIVQNCVNFSMNSNGFILINWFLDASQLAGRFRAVSPLLLPHVESLCCHKLASLTILKISN